MRAWRTSLGYLIETLIGALRSWPRRRTGPAPRTRTWLAPSGSAAEITASRHTAMGDRAVIANMPKVLVTAHWTACRLSTRPDPRSGLSRPGNETRSPRRPLIDRIAGSIAALGTA